ncbi:MAG: DNA repair protein RecN [Bacteroidales bacterium]
MLLKLSIKNYILIHDLEIDFSEGFSVITGETGAGKSILLGALGMILGQRADSGILLDKSGKCIIEGHFMINGYQLEAFFQHNELDFEETIILRREINQNGKSRAFINDTPVNLVLLKELGDKLVNIHSQNSIITLNDSNFQLAVIDSYAAIQSEVAKYRAGYSTLIEMRSRLVQIEEQEKKASAERDYFLFLLDELNQARLKEGELVETEEQLELLTHAEEIKGNLFQATQLISGADENILALLTEAGHLMREIERYKPELKDLSERIATNYIDLKDLSAELNNLQEQVYVDPPGIASLTQRLDHLYRLMKKHQVQTIEQLIVIREEIAKKVSDDQGVTEQLHRMRLELAALEAELTGQAQSLSVKRKKVLPEFEQEVAGVLSRLGISMPRFKIELTRSEHLSRDGNDRVKFLFSANKGIDLKELSSAASGGELSRIMLSIKSMIGQKHLLPTIIFDEIDNGVSGEVAGKVGGILKRMGNHMQVIAITHLPQIAAKGDQHYWVYKSEDNKMTTTYIRQLTAEDRIGEIAKMLSDETVTDSAIKTANELLNN